MMSHWWRYSIARDLVCNDYEFPVSEAAACALLVNGLGALIIFHLASNSSVLMATGTSIESNIIVVHLAHVSYTEIAGRLHVGQTRIFRIICPFR
jgi:hypothetical protein